VAAEAQAVGVMMSLLVLAATVDGLAVALVAAAEAWTQARREPGARVLTASSW
jgi:hypothetical protein